LTKKLGIIYWVTKDLSTEKGEYSQPIKRIKRRRATTGGCPYNMLSEANPANGGTHYEKRMEG
jgi:hypothetical protein